MFLKFHFINIDGCTGTFAIAIFNKYNKLIDNTKVKIIQDDFTDDIPVTLGLFKDTPSSSGPACRRWASGDAILIIEIPDKLITKLGISTWANTVYPLEKVTIYGSYEPDSDWTEICTIDCDSRILGCYKMSYQNVRYRTEPDRQNSNLYKDSYSQETFDFNKLLEV